MNQPIILSKLQALFVNMTARRIRYDLGTKAPNLHMDSRLISALDCSGFTQFCYAKSTDPSVVIPAGSWTQNDYFIEQEFREVRYVDLHYADPSRLFISTIRAGKHGAGTVGHVWFTRKNPGQVKPHTLECYGSHGVGSRSWDTPVLISQVFQTFEIPTI